MSQSNGRPAATIGSIVKVKEHGMEEEEEFRLGNVTNPDINQIAQDNAMGQALIGAQPGDEVTVDGPTGPIKFAVLDVQPEHAK
jgi:transcription elongation GreA/GreB family factor